MKTITKILTIGFSLCFISACGHDNKGGSGAVSKEDITTLVSNYPTDSADTVATIKDGNLVILVNLWKHREVIDKADKDSQKQLYSDLAKKVTKDTLDKKSDEEKTTIKSATVDFVYVDKQDEYGKPDFKSLTKKGKVTFTKEGEQLKEKIDVE